MTQRGEEQYTQWFSNAEKALQDVNHQKAFYVLTAHIDMLKVLKSLKWDWCRHAEGIEKFEVGLV